MVSHIPLTASLGMAAEMLLFSHWFPRLHHGAFFEAWKCVRESVLGSGLTHNRERGDELLLYQIRMKMQYVHVSATSPGGHDMLNVLAIAVGRTQQQSEPLRLHCSPLFDFTLCFVELLGVMFHVIIYHTVGCAKVSN